MMWNITYETVCDFQLYGIYCIIHSKGVHTRSNVQLITHSNTGLLNPGGMWWWCFCVTDTDPAQTECIVCCPVQRDWWLNTCMFQNLPLSHSRVLTCSRGQRRCNTHSHCLTQHSWATNAVINTSPNTQTEELSHSLHMLSGIKFHSISHPGELWTGCALGMTL